MDGYGELLKVIFYPARVLFALAAAAWFILLMPDRWAERLHLSKLREPHGHWIAICGLVLALLWLAQLWASARSAWAGRRRRREVLDNLRHLTPPEAFPLAFCLWRNQRTVYLPVIDAGAKALCEKGVLESASGYLNKFAIPYTIPPYVWRHLLLNKQLVFPELADPSPELERRLKEYEVEMVGRINMSRL